MSFLSDGEFILLMDIPLRSGRWLSGDELKKLRDAGIQTALWFGPKWDEFARDDMRTLNWGYFDRYLERMRAADLKCLIPLWIEQSRKYPAHYYIKSQHGYEFGIYTPWNPEAQERSNRMLKLVRDQLTSSTVQVISAQAQGGERVLLNSPAYFDDFAQADYMRTHPGGKRPNHITPEGSAWLREAYTRLLMEQQSILVDTQHREIWYQLATWKSQVSHLSCHGCNWINHFLQHWTMLEPAAIHHISFNYFPYPDKMRRLVREERETFGVNEWVGAEYCEGLKRGNGRAAMEQGLRGVLVGPTHPFTKHDGIKDWMVEEIAKTQRLFEEGRGRGAEKVLTWGAQSGRGLPHEKNSQCGDSG